MLYLAEEKRYSGRLFGIPFTSEPPLVIIDDTLDVNNISGININISEKVKSHRQLGYTTDLGTLKFIFDRRTIRSSSLNNAKLNDRMEKVRKGVEQFAGSRFITCFTHMESECIPFWAYYGGKDKTRKIQLVFDNFANNFDELFYLDYLIRDDCKVFFSSEEYNRTINQNGLVGASLGLPEINADFDTRSAVKSISIFDVDYLKADDEVFTSDYSGVGTVEFNPSSGLSYADGNLKIQQFNISCLGKQKSDPWSYECETRIMLSLSSPQFSEWDYLDIRFKDQLFKNMKIILSSWVSEEAYSELLQMIEDWNISDEIKKTIKIQRSVVEGTLNL